MGAKKRGDRILGKEFGLQLHHFSTAMTVGMVILCICLLYTTVDVQRKYDRVMDTTEVYVHWNKNATTVHEASEYLTEQARLFAQTAERKYIENYFMETYVMQRRTRVLEEISDVYADTQIANELEQAIYESKKLTEREYYAMKLVCAGAGLVKEYIPPEIQQTPWTGGESLLSPQEQWQKGVAVLYDATYQEAKESIYRHLENFTAQILEAEGVEQEKSVASFIGSIHTQQMFVGVLVFLELITLLILMQMITKPLQKFVKRIRERAMLDIDGVEELRMLAGEYNEMYEAIAAERVQFRYLPENDPLTGVLREETYYEIAKELEENTEPMALMIFRIDAFAALMAKHDAETVDWILKKAAALLYEMAGLKDHIFRVGREEFAVLFMDVIPEEREKLEMLFRKVNDRALDAEEELPAFSMSAGAAFSEQGWKKTLSGKAREALLRAHQAGTGALCFYEE